MNIHASLKYELIIYKIFMLNPLYRLQEQVEVTEADILKLRSSTEARLSELLELEQGCKQGEQESRLQQLKHLGESWPALADDNRVQLQLETLQQQVLIKQDVSYNPLINYLNKILCQKEQFRHNLRVFVVSEIHSPLHKSMGHIIAIRVNADPIIFKI